MREESEFKNERADGGPTERLRHGYAGRPGRLGKRGMAILALAAMLCGAGLAYGQNQKENKNKKKTSGAGASDPLMLPDNRAIDQLVSQMLGAWQAGDAEAMKKFYAADMTAISGAWEPPLFGWANYARAYQAQFERTSGCRLERTNSYTNVMGDAAWVTYQWQFLGNVDGKLPQAFAHKTLVLQTRPGTWLIVLNHTSAIRRDEPSAVTPGPASSGPSSSLAPNAR